MCFFTRRIHGAFGMSFNILAAARQGTFAAVHDFDNIST